MRLTDCHEFAIDLDQPGDHGAGFNGLLVAIGPTSELIEVVADPGELSQQGRVDLGTLAPARRLHAADGLPDQRRQCQAGRLRRLRPLSGRLFQGSKGLEAPCQPRRTDVEPKARRTDKGMLAATSDAGIHSSKQEKNDWRSEATMDAGSRRA